MINHKLLNTIEDRLRTLSMVKLSDKTIAFNPECDDLYSFVASVMYDTTYAECCEWKDDKPYPEGKERRDRVKQFLLPIVAECGGIHDN